MKKILFSLTFLLCSSLFSQDFTKIPVATNWLSTSKMIWNSSMNKWDFSSNEDMVEYKTEWIFNLRENGTGLLTNGSVNYDVNKMERIPSMENSYIFRTYNVKVGRSMDVIVSKTSDKVVVSVFDWESRTSYYFFQ
tara:strand:+ start:465 stop:872 length:408 start_codon:yes stop_codon:yes gene_type:complete